MLFRTVDGKIIEINKYDFKNDKIYYEKIMSIYESWFFQKPLAKL